MTKTLAERTHAAYDALSDIEEELLEAVTSACGPLATGDEKEWTTDYYDNSIEVYGVGDIDLDAAAVKLKESGFSLVWLHKHPPPRNMCVCKCR